jgi:hypothetical protein
MALPPNYPPHPPAVSPLVWESYMHGRSLKEAWKQAETFGIVNEYESGKFAKESEMTEAAIAPPEGFQFGCDPELFVLGPDGKAVSAYGLIPGTKEEPYKVEDGAVQVDGTAAEFNIDPCSTFKDFNHKIESVMTQLEKMLPSGHTLSAVPFMRFDQAVFDAMPEESKELGCSPDFNAWTGEVNPPPNDPDDPLMRCAAGHLHLSWTPPDPINLSDPQHIMNCRDIVKQLDWYLGGWSVRMDTDPTRRNLYGRAGACRFKNYGVEYRVLSNFWVTTRARRLAVWNRMQLAIQDMRKSFAPDRAGSSYNELLVEMINKTTPNKHLESNFPYPLRSTDTYRARY